MKYESDHKALVNIFVQNRKRMRKGVKMLTWVTAASRKKNGNHRSGTFFITDSFYSFII